MKKETKEKVVKKKITKDTNIMEAIEINPKSAEIFMMSGMGCVGCALSSVETVEQGLRVHGFSDKEVDNFIKELNKNLEEK